jgi:serine/threonine protein kinase
MAQKVGNNEGYFPSKKLLVRDSKRKDGKPTQDEEVRTLRRLNAHKDPHLIRLLATFTFDEKAHLIFPWANSGNLKELWKAPQLQPHRHNHSSLVVTWISSQNLGLTRALERIHYCPVETEDMDNLLVDNERAYGRHGDMKPENILWFKDERLEDKESSIGVLKIVDFGFADFRSEHSRSDVRRSLVGGFTDTYKAPEYDTNEPISPKYDIWSFGCILLQFMVWYLQGWDGVDTFSEERSDESRDSQIMTDHFFRLERVKNGALKAGVKPSVIDVSHRDTWSHQLTSRVTDV